MTVEQDEANDSQRTVYMLQRNVIKNEITDVEKVPMVQLSSDHEESSYAATRLWLFQKFWSSKEKRILEILANKNKDIFQQISEYLIQPSRSTVFKSVLLMMGSSLSNHSLIIRNMIGYLDGLKSFRTVKLSSNDCTTLKSTMSVLIRQIIDRRDLNDDVVEDIDEDNDDDEGYMGDFLPYDIDSTIDWFNKNESQQVIIIFEDAELFDSNVLTQIVSILQNTPMSTRFKFIFGLSSSTDLFEENLSTFVIEFIEGEVINLNKSSEVLTEITNTVLFDLKIEDNTDFLLLLGPTLLRELSKFEDNELAFIDILKYSYSIYFFNNPLSVLNLVSIDESEEEIEIDNKLIDLLRRTKSFRSKIEKLNVFNQNEELVSFFEDDEKLATDFRQNYRNLYKFGVRFYRLLDLLIALQVHFNDGVVLRTKYQLYSSIIQQDTDFYNSQFYQELLSLVSKNTHLDNFDKFLKEIDCESFITHDEINEEMGSKLIDEISSKTLRLICKQLSVLVDRQVRSFLKEFNEVSYKEVFTVDVQMDGGENIINWTFNPFIRSSLESALNNPNSYLFKSKGNSPSDELSKLIEPTLCELFTLYREANIVINIHDFFIAFKESIERKKLVSNMAQIISSSTDMDLQFLHGQLLQLNKDDLNSEEEIIWEKIVLSWFLQAMGDLEFIGFIKDAKKKSDSVEKLVWKGI